MATSQSNEIKSLPELTPEEFSQLMGVNAAEKSRKIFKNGSPANANIVAANIFKYSTDVRIYGDNMDGLISDSRQEYFSELSNFLEKDNFCIKVVLDRKEPKKSRSLNKLLELRKTFPTKILIYSSSEQFRNSVAELKVAEPNTIHFMVGDNDKFRLEYNNESKSAYFSFNNNDITSILSGVFDNNLSSCELY